jgi:hypothetical protein
MVRLYTAIIFYLAYRTLMGKPEVKRTLGIPRRRWVDNTLLNTVMTLGVPPNAGKFLSSCTTGSFSRMAQLHRV